jgi:hypothetical protein
MKEFLNFTDSSFLDEKYKEDLQNVKYLLYKDEEFTIEQLIKIIDEKYQLPPKKIIYCKTHSYQKKYKDYKALIIILHKEKNMRRLKLELLKDKINDVKNFKENIEIKITQNKKEYNNNYIKLLKENLLNDEFVLNKEDIKILNNNDIIDLKYSNFLINILKFKKLSEKQIKFKNDIYNKIKEKLLIN